jgi:hypothetical protein
VCSIIERVAEERELNLGLGACKRSQRRHVLRPEQHLIERVHRPYRFEHGLGGSGVLGVDRDAQAYRARPLERHCQRRHPEPREQLVVRPSQRPGHVLDPTQPHVVQQDGRAITATTGIDRHNVGSQARSDLDAVERVLTRAGIRPRPVSRTSSSSSAQSRTSRYPTRRSM